MGRAPCCDKANVKRGPWSPEEDTKLKDYIQNHGTGGNWIALPHKAGLKRCGKSCRLRWLNYLRPNIKHGEFSEEEDRIICTLYANIGSRWSIIATQLPGRTDNDIKNYWNTKLKKKLLGLVPEASIPHHQTKPPFQSSHHQNPPLIPSSNHSLSSSFYSPATMSFTGLEPSASMTMIPSSNYTSTISTSTSISLPFYDQIQNQEPLISSVISPMQYYPIRDSLLMFGSEGSCSSSDGSCSQVSHGGREIKQEEMGGFHNYMFEEYNNYRFMLRNASNINDGSAGENIINQQWTDQPNGCSSFFQTQTTPLDYDLENIKQLISSNSNSISSNSNGYLNLNIDENKTEEKAIMYYY